MFIVPHYLFLSTPTDPKTSLLKFCITDEIIELIKQRTESLNVSLYDYRRRTVIVITKISKSYKVRKIQVLIPRVKVLVRVANGSNIQTLSTKYHVLLPNFVPPYCRHLMKSTVIAKLGNIKTVGECTEVLRLIEPKYYESDFAKISDELPLYLQRKDVVKKKRERWKQMCMLSIKRMSQPTLKVLGVAKCRILSKFYLTCSKPSDSSSYLEIINPIYYLDSPTLASGFT